MTEENLYAIRIINNWCGDHDIQFIIAYVKEGIWMQYDTDEPVLEYEGDKILQVWNLFDEEPENE